MIACQHQRTSVFNLSQILVWMVYYLGGQDKQGVNLPKVYIPSNWHLSDL